MIRPVTDQRRVVDDYHAFANRDAAAIAAAEERAMADVAAGRVHSHEIVREWLMTWGKPGRLPFKDWLARRHG